jgi:ATP-dependent Lhr-like helicase
MLQGFEIAAAAWERDILPSRVAGYRPEWLDELCLTGEVAWGRLSPRRSGDRPGTLGKGPATSGSTSRATPVALLFRRELGWMLEAVRGGRRPETPSVGSPALAFEALQRRGALFLDDLARAAHLGSADLVDALWDLVGRGLVASDGFQPLRELMASGRGRRGARPAQGRWSIVEDPSRAAGPDAPATGATPPDAHARSDDLADRVAGQLLARYGVVFREMVARESFAVPWRDVLRSLRRREARGLVRGGRFVAGFMGEQYALPEAVDALRRVRRQERTGELVRVCAADPLNLVGVIAPGARVPAHHGGWVIFRDGAFEGAEDRAGTGSGEVERKDLPRVLARGEVDVESHRTVP